MVYVKTFDISIVKAFRQVLQNYPNRIMYVNALTQEEWTYAKVSNYEFGTFKIYNKKSIDFVSFQNAKILPICKIASLRQRIIFA